MRIWTLALSLALTACGGAPPSAAEPAPPPSAPAINGQDAVNLAQLQNPQCTGVRFDQWLEPRRALVDVCGALLMFVWDEGGSVRAATEADVHPPVVGSAPRSADPGYTPQSSGSSGPVHVRGYYRRDGTYVHPHTRRRPR